MSPKGSPTLAATIALNVFLPWYFVRQPLAIIRSYGEYCAALNEIFSFSFLLKTLFSPWKGIIDAYPSKGLDLGKIFQSFVLNCMTRMIGFCFRIVTIAIGLLFHVIFLTVFACWLAMWVLYPLLVPVSLAYIVKTL
jgi:hypothetical protein